MTDSTANEARIAEIKAEIAARDARILEMWEGHAVPQIAESVGMAGWSIRNRARQLGLRLRSNITSREALHD